MCIVRHRGCTPLIPTLGVLCESEASLVFIKSSPEGRTFPPHTCFEASISGGCACEKILEHRSGPQPPQSLCVLPKTTPLSLLWWRNWTGFCKQWPQASSREGTHLTIAIPAFSTSLVWLHCHLFNYEFAWQPSQLAFENSNVFLFVWEF